MWCWSYRSFAIGIYEFFPWTLVFPFCSVALFYDLLFSPVPISLFAVVAVVVVCWLCFICIRRGGWLRYGLGKDLVDVVVSFICPNAYLACFLRSSTSSGKIPRSLMIFWVKSVKTKLIQRNLCSKCCYWQCHCGKGQRLKKGTNMDQSTPNQNEPRPQFNEPMHPITVDLKNCARWNALVLLLKCANTSSLQCTSACVEMHQCLRWNAPMPALRCTDACVKMHQCLALKCTNACAEMHRCLR